MSGVTVAVAVLVALSPVVQALDALVVRLDWMMVEWCQAFCLKDRWGYGLAQVLPFLVEVWHCRLPLVIQNS
jgi:hypothetical protein